MDFVFCDSWAATVTTGALAGVIVFFLFPRALFLAPLAIGVATLGLLATVGVVSATDSSTVSFGCDAFFSPSKLGIALGIIVGALILGVRHYVNPQGPGGGDRG